MRDGLQVFLNSELLHGAVDDGFDVDHLEKALRISKRNEHFN